jgi:hypothetical protein
MVSVDRHSARHIERLNAAYSLERQNFLRFARISGSKPLWQYILGLELFTLQCHMNCMNQIKTVCVYCGSGSGSNHRFLEAATALGKVFAENSIRLVYGGGSVGLMGAVAKSVLDHGGAVTGSLTCTSASG